MATRVRSRWWVTNQRLHIRYTTPIGHWLIEHRNTNHHEVQHVVICHFQMLCFYQYRYKFVHIRAWRSEYWDVNGNSNANNKFCHKQHTYHFWFFYRRWCNDGIYFNGLSAVTAVHAFFHRHFQIYLNFGNSHFHFQCMLIIRVHVNTQCTHVDVFKSAYWCRNVVYIRVVVVSYLIQHYLVYTEQPWIMWVDFVVHMACNEFTMF